MPTLWYDELLSLQRASLPFWEHMRIQVSAWEILLRLFADPRVIRIPSMLAILLSAWMIWRLTHSIPSLAVFCLLPGVLWMASDARYYAGITACGIGALVCVREHRWLGLYALAGLSIYIHPTAPAFVIPALLIAAMDYPPRRIWLWWLTLPVIWLPRVMQLGVGPDSLWTTFWLADSDASYVFLQAGLAIGASPANINLALIFIVVTIGCALVARAPVWSWITFVTPLLILLMVGLVRPVMFYRTMQPSLAGLALLYVNVKRPHFAIILLYLMLLQYDPFAHNGHIQRGADLVHTLGGCVYVADEFSQISTSLVLADVPHCRESGADWLITTVPQVTPAFVTDGWHFPSIYFKQVNDAH